MEGKGKERKEAGGEEKGKGHTGSSFPPLAALVRLMFIKSKIKPSLCAE